jgi:ribosomal protein S6
MRHYEVMLILDPSLEDKDAKAAVEAVDRFLTTVTSRGGTVGNSAYWGELPVRVRDPAQGRPA